METLAIGIIQTSYGIKGELKVKSLSGEIDHFFKLDEITIGQGDSRNKFIIEHMRESNKSIFMKLKGIDNPEDGKCLAGCQIFVTRDKACPVHENEFYFTDLVGCEILKDSISMGHVLSIIESVNNCLLEIGPVSGDKIMIPFKKQFIEKVDIQSRKIYLTKEAEIF